MAITYITDYTVIQDCDDPTTDWTGTGDMPVQTNQNGSVPQFYIEGIACVATELGAEKQGYHTHTQTFSLTGRALVIYNWLTGPGELAVLEYWTNRVYQGANYVDYDLLPELLTLAQGGWLPYVLWPTPDATQAHITNSGTPTVSGITAVEVRGYNSGTTINIKVMGYDIVGAIGYLGGHSDTITIGDLSTRSKEQYYGVITEKGGTVKSFQVQCMIRYGGGTGTTTINESNKTITFRGANPDHPVGYEFVTGGTTNFTMTDMVFNWEFPQPAFELTVTPNTLKLIGCSFNGAGTIELPAYSTLRWAKTSKFNDCGEIDIGDCIFEDNTVSNATSGVFYDGTGTRRSKNNTYTGNTDALHFDTAQTITLDGDSFSGNTTDIHFSGTGTLTINKINGANPTTSRVSGGGTVVINQPSVTITQTCATAAGVGIQNARVLVGASNGTGPMPFEDSVTITRVTTTATVTHTAHGMVTGDKVLIDGAVQQEYNGVKTITVTTANAYTYTVSGTPATPATGTIISTWIVLSGLTDVNGEITTTKVLTADQPVSGWGRKSTTSPLYVQGSINGTIDYQTGYSQTAVLISDE